MVKLSRRFDHTIITLSSINSKIFFLRREIYRKEYLQFYNTISPVFGDSSVVVCRVYTFFSLQPFTLHQSILMTTLSEGSLETRRKILEKGTETFIQKWKFFIVHTEVKDVLVRSKKSKRRDIPSMVFTVKFFFKKKLMDVYQT